MQANVATVFGQDELAIIFGKTTRHLERTFNLVTGETPMSIYLVLRLEQAQDLLAATTVSMPDVAGTIGINSRGSSTKAFRRRFNSSPTRLR
jgi:transcriptional regulator GlxA family with amidase domain